MACGRSTNVAGRHANITRTGDIAPFGAPYPRRMARAPLVGQRPVIRLSTRLAVLSGGFVVVLMAGATGSALAMHRWTDALDHRRAVRLAAIDVADLRVAYSEQLTAVRVFLLTGDRTFLEPYFRGVTAEASSLRRLDDRRDELGAAGQLLDDIGAAATRWRTETAEPSIARRDVGVTPDQALTDFGNGLAGAILAPLDRLDENMRAMASRADDEAARIQWLALGGASVTLVVALLGAVLVVALFQRWVTRPMARIGTTARAIGHGDQVTMPAMSAVELRDVVSAVDFLQNSLSEARDRAVRAYETLEQSAVLALHVRSELADQHGPAPEGWELASTMRAAEGLVAGDCFDIGLVSPTALYIVMIDVTGHGAVAALHALKAKSQLRTAVKSGLAPGAAMSSLARQHGHDTDVEYLTAFVAVVDIHGGTCAYANAGHPPAFLTSASTVVELAATGPLVGPFDATWETEHVTVAPGASLVVYTDGLTEACGTGRERLGEAPVRDLLRAVTTEGARTIVDSLVALVDRHRHGPLVDDLSVVALHRTGDDMNERDRRAAPAIDASL